MAVRYRCSKCGTVGHNRRRCPDVTGKALPSIPLPETADIPFETPPAPITSEFKVGDRVRIVSAPAAWDHAYTGWEFDVEEVSRLHISGKAPHGVKEHYYLKADLVLEKVSPAATPAARKISIRDIDVWDLTEATVKNSRITLLYGPPGTGKTTAGNFVGSPSEVFNVTLTEETPAAEVRGHYVPKGGEFVWQDGPGMAAFRNGGRLVANEIDKASTDCLTFFYNLLDDPPIAKITLPTGETVHAHPTFSCVATTNGIPEDLPEALQDRFSVRIFVDKPHPAAVASLPEDLRVAATNAFSKEHGLTFRNWKAFATLRDSIGVEYAAKAVFGERAEVVLNTLRIGKKAGSF